MAYAVGDDYIERYADLLVNFALGGGDGIKAGDWVQVVGPESAKPLYAAVCRAVWAAGGDVIHNFRLDEDAQTSLARDFFSVASAGQIANFPEHYHRGVIDQIDHSVFIISEADPHAMQSVDPAKLIARQGAMRPLIGWRDAKENAGNFSWTIGLYGTEAMAAEAQMSIEEYWEQIILACYLDETDPKVSWRGVTEKIEATIAVLDGLAIERLHITGQDADLWITVGEKRRWLGGGGNNIPSFEIFTSPDWRGTEGWIRFSEPLYTHGNLITGIELTFENGLVTKATATENEALLTEMLAAENADRIGEFSLTDGRFSRITKFMASTLYDENVGGPFGNTHLAVGKAYAATYDGDPGELTADDMQRLGFNDSVIHTDIVSTTDRQVTAVLSDGSEQVIYSGGQFRVGT